MNLLQRRLLAKRTNTDKVNFSNKMLTTRQIYTSDLVLINFDLGQEIYFLIVKNKLLSNLNKNEIVSMSKLETLLINSEIKALSIDLNAITGSGFKRECEIINKFIGKSGTF